MRISDWSSDVCSSDLAASLWCGLAGSVDTLIAARVVQGIGAALLTPQTLSTITRIFPPERRGVAMSVWGATAGVRSEERRVGKECVSPGRYRGSPAHSNKQYQE